MNPSLATSPVEELTNPALRIETFLDFVDRVAEIRGVNVPPIVDIEELRSLPIGTFGRTWADFLDKNQLKPITTGSRRKQLHDGVHVLTGYGTDPIGEAEVQAFLVGAKFRLVNLLLGLGLLRLIYRQQAQKTAALQRHFNWELLWSAYQRGYDSRFDPDAWEPELLWDLPLAKVQSLFGV